MNIIKSISLLAILFFCNFIVNAQQTSTATRSNILYQALDLEIDSNHTTSKWNIALVNYSKTHKTEAAFQRIIDKKSQQKIAMNRANNVKYETKDSLNSPKLGRSFKSNPYNGLIPPDNTLAISKDGIIVSAVNTNLSYYDSLGNNLFNSSFDDYLNDSTLTSLFFDPMIQYDSEEDRFVMFILHGSTDNKTKVISMFSKTSNPLDGWYVYYLDGSPMYDTTYFDYPKIGISDSSIFVSGNLFSETKEYIESVVFEIDKNSAYQGDTLKWAYWNNFDQRAATIVPVSYGHKGNYGSQMYFISSFSWNDTVNMIPYMRLYHLNSTLSDTNPQMSFYSQILPFDIPVNAMQKGTTDLLSINGPGILDAFYLNGFIHFVYTSGYANIYSGINYNRLNLSNMTNWHSVYGNNGFDCAFPSLASFTNDSTDKSVMITYLRSGATIYPESRVIYCDDAGNWSGSSLIKEGEMYVSAFSGNVARWGDYTDVSRDHNSPFPKVWTHSCFGYIKNTGSYTITYLNNVIASIDGFSTTSIMEDSKTDYDSRIYPNPVYDMYKLEFELLNSSKVDIRIIDANGKLVELLYNDKARVGRNVFSFNKGALSSGIYFVVLNVEAENNKIVKKIIVN